MVVLDGEKGALMPSRFREKSQVKVLFGVKILFN